MAFPVRARGRHLADLTPQPSLAPSRRALAVLAAAASLLAVFIVVPSLYARATGPVTGCGNAGPGPAIKHVIVVMLENQSYGNVVGNSVDAPYVNTTLTKQCSYATNMYAATHYSAANYLGITAGQYPPESPAGCGYVAACNTAVDNVFHQAETNALSWKAYEESMPSACAKSSSGTYSLGHNPVPFYDDIKDCATYDVPVTDLTAPSGLFWNDLQNRTLPSYSFVTPNNVDNGHDTGTGVDAIDSFLSEFVPLVQSTNTYQDGATAMFITFDEGAGGVKAQDCTNQAQDMAGNQESCHIPFFVVYPYAGPGPVGGFFDHYSVTRTTEELLHLPLLAGAATAPSLVGPFGLSMTTPTPTPTVSISPSPTVSPTPNPTTTEYARNGSFESGTETAWSGIYTANSVTAVTQQPGQMGSYCLAISSTAPDKPTVGVTSKPAVITGATAGTALTGSVSVQASAPGMLVTQLVWERAPDGTNVGYQGRSISLQDTSWHRIRAATPYVVKHTGDDIFVSLYTKQLPAGATLYADGFSLTAPAS